GSFQLVGDAPPSQGTKAEIGGSLLEPLVPPALVPDLSLDSLPEAPSALEELAALLESQDPGAESQDPAAAGSAGKEVVEPSLSAVAVDPVAVDPVALDTAEEQAGVSSAAPVEGTSSAVAVGATDSSAGSEVAPSPEGPVEPTTSAPQVVD
ncbi:MAG: hypothetical protein ACRDV9_03145, partial [Acidimicrobiia bacterium]